MKSFLAKVRTSWRREWPKAPQYTVLYLLMLPTLIGLALFIYWPNLDVFRYAFYRWKPGLMEDFLGFRNFIAAWNDNQFRHAFLLAFLLLAANLVKMLPSIFAAILLHRLRNDRLRYFFQVLFVVPMVIPGLVWLLLWKGFMDPNVGLINATLNATGLMQALAWLDGRMYRVADALYPLGWALDHLFSRQGGAFLTAMPSAEAARHAGPGAWGWLLAGILLLFFAGGLKSWRRWPLLLPLLPAVWLLWGAQAVLLLPALALLIFVLRRDGQDGRLGEKRLRLLGWASFGGSILLLLLTRCWDHRIGAFDEGNPAWLAHSDLIVPSVIFWGFPWVQTVGVMIYLAGLQQISTEVYEAAELDGLGSLGKVFYIELPLIMTQVRINLIFMTIATLNSYGFFLVLLGPEGGPGGKGLVPGLYMYQKAFVVQEFGYACALGLILFVIILFLTLIYQRYVRVEK